PFCLAGDARAAEDAELERADADVEPALPRLRLGQPDAADLRIAVRAPRDLFVVDRPELLARDPLRERDAFSRGAVRELLMAGRVERDDVADRRDAGHVRPVLRVHPNVAAVELQPRLFC